MEARPSVSGRTLERTLSSSSAYDSFIPSSIWEDEWEPNLPSFLYVQPCTDLSAFAEHVYEAAVADSDSAPPELRIRGCGTARQVEALRTVILEAARIGDFTKVLSPNRHFVK